ncbi:MAG: hypothetical protein RLZZ450_6921 [Pseudomonadota bacterium]
MGVALNAALELMGVFELGSIAVSGPAGQAVEFTVNAGPTPTCPGTSASVVPKQPLLPNTKYVVKVRTLTSEPGPTSFVFTTGTASLPDEVPAAPTGAASVVFDVAPDGQSCGDGTNYACVGVDLWDNVEVLAKKGDETLLRWVLKANDGLFSLRQQPDCIELRRLSATGRRSDPLKICGDALKPRAYTTSDRDSNQWIQCTNGVVGPPVATSTNARADAGATSRVDAGTPQTEVPTSTQANNAAAPEPSSKSGCAIAPTAQKGASTPLLVSITMLLAAAKRRRRPA